MELDVYEQALAKRQQQAERLATAHAQHLARLRYEAAYCERQFHHVDPAHRHVAAELEHAWELALQALKQAEAAEQQRAQASTPPAHALPPALQAAFAPLASPSRNSGPLTCCRRHSARPCCVVSSTRW